MGIQRRHHLHRVGHATIGFWTIYPLSVIFIFHSLLVAYINSSYMEQFVSSAGVGALYSIGSAVAVIAFLFFNSALLLIGNVRLTLILAVLDILSLLMLAGAETMATAVVAFIVFLVVNPLLFLNIDIFSETLIGNDETATGRKRGITLGLMSFAAMLSPLAMAFIVGDGEDLSLVYYSAAGFFLLFIVFILVKFKTFVDPLYDKVHITTSLRKMWLKSDIRNVLFSHLLLQIFFSWVVIYMSLYLSTEIGLSWKTIGYLTTIALSAYVILEFPIGIIADRWLGEKEIMAVGFLILAISASWIAFLDTTDFVEWAVLVFMTRVGASMVEITTESYFFKHTDGGDADAIGFFRLLRPLSMLLGALLGGATLLYLPFNLTFVVLGFLMIPGLFSTMALHDTK